MMALQRGGAIKTIWAFGHRSRAAAVADSAFTISPIRSNRTISTERGAIGGVRFVLANLAMLKASPNRIRSMTPRNVRLRYFIG